MQKLLILLTLLLWAASSKAQDTASLYMEGAANSSLTPFDVHQQTELQKGESYKNTACWKRHKRQKIGAWTALGAGVCGTAIGLVASMGTAVNGHKEAVWDVVCVSGICLTASSAPLFICSRRNKKKAKLVGLTANSICMVMPGGNFKSTPALGLCINF